ncbi:MAG: hypothetical protein AB2L20_27915 [Mangrovibacterium sp.]
MKRFLFSGLVICLSFSVSAQNQSLDLKISQQDIVSVQKVRTIELNDPFHPCRHLTTAEGMPVQW